MQMKENARRLRALLDAYATTMHRVIEEQDAIDVLRRCGAAENGFDMQVAKSELRNHSRLLDRQARRLDRERGAIILMVACLLPVLLLFALLTMQVGLLLVHRGLAQNSADAAALAGAISLGQPPAEGVDVICEAEAVAVSFAQRNAPAGLTGEPSIAATFPTPDLLPACALSADGLPTCVKVDVAWTTNGFSPFPSISVAASATARGTNGRSSLVR